MKVVAAVLLAAACVVHAETIDVPSGQTRKVEPGQRFSGGKLVKTGAGVLDLSGAALANTGLEIREGTVRLAGGGACAVSTRFMMFKVSSTRPGKKGAPEYAGSGSQFSEFRLYLDGKPLPFPEGTKAIMGPVGAREGPDKGIDGNLKTKCYYNPLALDFGREVTFDAYSFVTANDAIGRDPASWTMSAGMDDGFRILWQEIGSVTDFVAPTARFTEAGRTFPVSLSDAVPFNCQVTVCGKGRLVLVDLNEHLERVDGNGLIVLERSTLELQPGVKFAGSVCGGCVKWPEK